MDIQPAPSAGGDNTPSSPAAPAPGREPLSFYEAVGGEDTFTRLVHRFYELVAGDPELRGHPRLRMRHARFVIAEAERDAWLRHMRTALDELALDEALDAQLWNYLVMAAHSLVNRPAGPGGRDLGLTPS